MMSISVGIIGAGLIGRKRAMALPKFDNCKLKVVVDVDRKRAEELAAEFGTESETDWGKVVRRKDIDVIIVATYNKYLMPISVAALNNKKHVLCEKPLGRNIGESKQIIDAAKQSDVILKTGFNHRHHPAIAKAKELFTGGKIGKLYFLRCCYGHGGRPGYDKEWRADKDLCGGGELLDQGVHVVDLFRWLAGDFDEAFGYTETYFWNMEVEDNAFAIFKKDNGVVATMHTSWTQWKNRFSFEVYGSEGYLIVDGLGGGYGTETLRIGKRKPEGGPPYEEIMEFRGPDISWGEEWKEFISAIKEGREPLGNGWDGYQANRMIQAVYESAKTGKVIRLED
ncbi:TPA: Gfo/Idh/MocA family oxidoreductase [Candidatus Poribacteria bacterium]|nr:Gfo/Idh/MocA family oxidoreductase [Candidatus Poribacteria bacterium]